MGREGAGIAKRGGAGRGRGLAVVRTRRKSTAHLYSPGPGLSLPRSSAAGKCPLAVVGRKGAAHTGTHTNQDGASLEVLRSAGAW